MDCSTLSQGGTAITTDLSQNDRAVHVDFFNSMSSITSSSNLSLSLSLPSYNLSLHLSPHTHTRTTTTTGFDDVFDDNALD